MQDVDESMGGDSDARWWRRMRLVLLRHIDRLDTLLALHKGWVGGHQLHTRLVVGYYNN
jgi:hypothetical protein